MSLQTQDQNSVDSANGGASQPTPTPRGLSPQDVILRIARKFMDRLRKQPILQMRPDLHKLINDMDSIELWRWCYERFI